MEGTRRSACICQERPLFGIILGGILGFNPMSSGLFEGILSPFYLGFGFSSNSLE